jgi:hypothetical protein
MNEDSLMTASELAGIMGLRDAQAVLDLRLRPVAFPEPVGRVNRSLVWSWYDVERWGRVGPPAVAGMVGAGFSMATNV